MNLRERFKLALNSTNPIRPPRIESDFAPDVLQSWRAAHYLNGTGVEEFFGLDRRENLPVNWSRLCDRRRVIENDTVLGVMQRAYDPADPARLPGDWDSLVRRCANRDFVLRVSPWDEGLLQIIGITEWESFYRAVMLFFDKPSLIEAIMERYADFLEAFLDRVLGQVQADYAVLYEVIAWNRALVISPEMYRQFALPALRRVIACLERHGIGLRFVWTTGAVGKLIPMWLEAGVNGLLVTQTAASGIDYLELRREYGRELRLMGGLDWEEVCKGPRAIDDLLRRVARPLLEQGAAIPHLDDRIRKYMPYENYAYFRQRLNALIDEIHGVCTKSAIQDFPAVKEKIELTSERIRI